MKKLLTLSSEVDKIKAEAIKRQAIELLLEVDLQTEKREGFIKARQQQIAGLRKIKNTVNQFYLDNVLDTDIIEKCKKDLEEITKDKFAASVWYKRDKGGKIAHFDIESKFTDWSS